MRPVKNSHSNYGLVYNTLCKGEDGALVKAPMQFDTLPQSMQAGVLELEQLSRAIGPQTLAEDGEPHILDIPIKTSMTSAKADKRRASQTSKKASGRPKKRVLVHRWAGRQGSTNNA